LRHNDLRLTYLFHKVNDAYFEGQKKIKGIFWAEENVINETRHPRKQLWAQCLVDWRGIRIHRCLKNKAPDYVLKHLIHHELLHLHLDYHTQRFIILERKFRQYKKADLWLDRHVHLLRQAR